MRAFGGVQSIEQYPDTLEVFSALGGGGGGVSTVHWGDISIVMKHPQCTDDIHSIH